MNKWMTICNVNSRAYDQRQKLNDLVRIICE